MKLSICMMVKNEEKYLDMCLSSLKPIRDSIISELIIVDTGSTDNTVEIAKRYTDKVFFHEWNNNFADMRNKTINYARGEWLLILDGDEIIENPEGIINFLKSNNSKNYNTGIITIKNITDKNVNSSVEATIVRLFRNKNFYYIGSIHEQPQFKLPVFEIKTNIIHYGYLSNDKDLMEYKFKRNLELIKNELNKDPENIYFLFQLSQTYGMHGDKKLALDSILKAYNIAKKSNINLSDKMYIYCQLAFSYYKNNKYSELEKVSIEALKYNSKIIDFYYYAALAQMELNKLSDAVIYFEKYLDLLDNNSFYKDPSIFNNTLNLYEVVYIKLCELYIKDNNLEKALYYINKVKSEDNIKFVIISLVKIYIKQKNFSKLNEYYHKIILNDEKYLKIFYTILENELYKLEEDEKLKIFEIFSKDGSIYSLLYNVRLEIIKNNYIMSSDLIEKSSKIDFNDLPISYADILYYLVKNNVLLDRYLANVNKNVLIAQFDYIAKKFDDFIDIMTCYLKNKRGANDIVNLRINKVIERKILIMQESQSELKGVWDYYLNDGISYISKVYSSEIIENELIYDIGNNEDAFFVYMRAAQKVKIEDKLKCVKYLRKALKVYPCMKKCIELLTREAEELMTEKKPENKVINSEFEILKNAVKSNIKILLEAKKHVEAEAIINEYLSIVPNDLEMISLKSDIKLRMIQ